MLQNKNNISHATNNLIITTEPIVGCGIRRCGTTKFLIARPVKTEVILSVYSIFPWLELTSCRSRTVNMSGKLVERCNPTYRTFCTLLTADIDVLHLLAYINTHIIQYVKLLEACPGIISVNINRVCLERASDSPVS